MTPHIQPRAGLADEHSHWLDTYPEHLSRTWTLASGEIVLVRPVRHDDDEREEAFVRGLSRESAYQRLLSGGIKITPEWIEHMTHVDYHRHMAFAITTANRSVEQIVGVGRYVVAPGSARAEIALVIADAWQGQGLGRRLLETLLEHAEEAGLHEVAGTVLATNRAMLGLARLLGFTVSAEPGDATVVRIRRSLAKSNPQPH
ncbi:MAG TPA: GNAT family N-acetyltransferase [Casimicrobiaceae bacterium]|nr:GNAT family N-acetyltransferase [Casimicrobiaceae bacterium]